MVESTIVKSRFVRDQILDRIRHGKFSAGQRLPSEKQLAKELEVNHQTVRRGLDELVEKGFIIKKAGVGNFVKEVQTHDEVTQIAIVFPDRMFDGAIQSVPDHQSGDEANYRPPIQHHPVPMLVLSGVCRALDQKKYALTTLFYRPNHFEFDVGHILQERGIKGVLLWPHAKLPLESVSALITRGIQIVLLTKGSSLVQTGLFSVSFNHEMALAQILDRFYNYGHRRIVYTRYGCGPEPCDEVFHSFVRRVGLDPRDNWTLNIINEDNYPDFRVIQSLFDRQPMPTAVVANDEFIASRIFSLCFDRHIRVPGNLSIAALCDNTPDSHPVRLTAPNSVELRIKSAEIATQHLLHLLEGKHFLEQETHLRCDVEWKDSIGPVPAETFVDKEGRHPQ